ncbi:MAG: arsenite methyltransferase [Gemmatimonadota bacterium]|nr:arsenite methyltransferase [Gemmatimonadota bacterium]
MGGEMEADIRNVVRDRYAKAAVGASGGGCCGGACGDPDPITRDLYEADQEAAVPAAALAASLGCGNPTALAELREGETVLDLGSGGGIDVILSARRVGPSGRAIGVDMTDEMLELARRNAAEAGVPNVEFRRGDIENLPVADGEVDVVISNCVINLSGDKPRVLIEAFRALRPGGRFAVSDVVVRGEIPAEVRRSLELWAGCVAGALEEDEYRRLLAEAGFEEIGIEPTRIYGRDDLAAVLAELGPGAGVRESDLEGRLLSAFIRARKPAA